MRNKGHAEKPEHSAEARAGDDPAVPALLGCFDSDGVSPPHWAKSGPQALADLPVLLPCRLFVESPRLSSLFQVSQAQSLAPERGARDREPETEGKKTGREKRRSRDGKRGTKDEDSLPLIPGAILDKYRIEEVIGRGAFAVVYRATHLMLRTQVAIKTLLPKVFASNPKHAAMLSDEARLAARVDHPNVVRVWDIGQSSTLTYIVMEFVEGLSLAKQIAKRKRIPPNELLSIAADVAAGLEAALQRGVIHRDIKPSNILVTKDGSAKVIDLGLACHASPTLSGAELHKLQFPAHAVVGTPTYMSPEQVRQPREIDYRSDIYSLGVTLYHAAVGSPPFVARSVADLEGLFQSTTIAPAADLVPNFPWEFSTWIERMMARERQQRPASYAEIRAAMASLLERLGR